LVGWGGVVERLLGDRAPTGWALRAIWGIAAVLAVGGPLAALHIASKPVLLAQVIVGLFLAAYFVFVRARQGERRTRVYAKTVASLGLVTSGFAIVHFFGYLGFNVFQRSDDQPLYFLLAEKLVQTGSFYEPFNVRRLLTYGGQAYLHALYLAVAPHDFLHVLDGGLGFAIVAGLLLGDLPARPSRPDVERVWLAVTLLIALPSVRTNIGSLMTGCAVFIGIYQTLRRPWHDPGVTGPKSTIAGTVLVGVLVATAGLLRTSNAIPAAIFAALSLLPRVQELLSREVLRSALRAQVILAVGVLITLVPWLLLFRESCGAAIYPLQKGYLTPGFVMLMSNPSVFANLQSLLAHVFYERPLNNLPLFVLAAFLPAAGNDRLVRAVSWSTLLGFCLIVYAGGAFSAYNNSRYYFGFVSGFALIMALTARRSQTVADMIPIGVRDVVIVIAVLANLVGGRADVAHHYQSLLESAQRGRRDAALDARVTEAKTRGYRDLQSHMEAGAKAVMMVDEPFRFDLRRNEMMSLDIGGGMGPSPGYPAFKGAEALGSYLVANGVRYIVYVDFAHSAELYVRAAWQSHLIKASDPYLQGEAPYMLDAMSSIDALAASRAVVHSKDWMSVVDLSRSRAP
jgi:hypothetical protein